MNIAVVFAGGKGSRMKAEIPKQFIEINNKPIIIYTLEIFEKHSEIDYIYISCIESWKKYLKELVEKYHLNKVKKIVNGGSTGQLSIYNGIKAAYEDFPEEDNIVLVHDAVRPFIDDELISNNIKSVKKYGTAISSANATETFSIVDENRNIVEVVNRNSSMIARAPQSFYLAELVKTHEQALKDGIDNSIDSCSLMYHYKKQMHIVECSIENIKITTKKDIEIVKELLSRESN